MKAWLIKAARLLSTPLALVLVWLMRKHRVRIGGMWNDRLGHLIGNTECYLCERDEGKHAGYLDIWMVRPTKSNRLIEKRYLRTLHTGPYWFLDWVMRVNRLWPGWERCEVQSAQFDRDIFNLWEKHSPHIGLSRADERRGKRLLRKMGMPEDAKWVCLMVRDKAFLNTLPGDWSYHDYRDSAIEDYYPVAVELLRRGYWVLRMGRVVAKPFHVKHSRMIDYANSKYRSDFADLYLGAKCEFCVGSSTGFVYIPQSFGRPIVYVNHVPLEYAPTYDANSLLIWKHHVKDGKRMSVKEICASGAGQFTYSQQYAAHGITLEDNSPEEIYWAVMEQLEGRDTAPQPAFWDAFPLQAISPYNGVRLHGEAKMRIGREFLKGYE